MKDPFDPDSSVPGHEEDDPLEQFELNPDELRPDEPAATGRSAPPGLKKLFWKLVLLYKVALIGVTLGVLLVVFGVDESRGGALVLGGLALLGYALYLTKRGKTRVEDGEFDTGGTDEGTPGETGETT